MFFILSKILGFVTLPSNLIGLLCGVGLVLMWLRWRRTGVAILTAGVCLLLLLGFSPASNWLLLPLSERFPAWQADGGAPDGIIILGGAIDSELSDARGSVELDASGERILAMLQLARRYPQARIVFSGGSGNLMTSSVPEAPFAGRLLQEFGLAGDRVILENESRTTEENAAFTRKLVTPRPGERWLLVTSAFHMPRSVGLFRQAGFDVEAYPVDFRTRGWGDASTPFDKLSTGLARSDVAIHEWTGMIGYWLLGRSPELFPAPRPR